MARKKINNLPFDFPAVGILKHHIGHLHSSLKEYIHLYQESIKLAYDGHLPANHVSYLCPLCLISLIDVSESAVGSNQSFSLDHYPPESVGGINTVLVCKTCNNTAGSQYEGQLIKELNHRAYKKHSPHASIAAKLSINSIKGSYGATFTIDGNGQTLIDFGKMRNKEHLARWMKEIAKGPSSWEISATLPHVDEQKLARALVKTAFLYCFTLWGYEFAFSETAAHIRQFLSGEIDYPIKGGYSYWIENDAALQIPQGVCFIDDPVSARNYVVNIPMIIAKPDYKCVVGVLVPKPTAGGWEDLKIYQFPKDVEVKIRELYHYDINKILNGYSSTWEKVVAGTMEERPKN